MSAADGMLVPFAVMGAAILLGVAYFRLLSWWRDRLAQLNATHMARLTQEIAVVEPHELEKLLRIQRELAHVERTHLRIAEIDRKLGRVA